MVTEAIRKYNKEKSKKKSTPVAKIKLTKKIYLLPFCDHTGQSSNRYSSKMFSCYKLASNTPHDVSLLTLMNYHILK